MNRISCNVKWFTDNAIVVWSGIWDMLSCLTWWGIFLVDDQLGNNRISSISTTLSTFNGPPNLTSHYYPYFSLLLSFPFSSSLKQSISNPPTSVACSTSSWIPWRLGRSVILFSFVASPPFNARRQSSTLWNALWDADVYVIETQDD